MGRTGLILGINWNTRFFFFPPRSFQIPCSNNASCGLNGVFPPGLDPFGPKPTPVPCASHPNATSCEEAKGKCEWHGTSCAARPPPPPCGSFTTNATCAGGWATGATLSVSRDGPRCVWHGNNATCTDAPHGGGTCTNSDILQTSVARSPPTAPYSAGGRRVPSSCPLDCQRNAARASERMLAPLHAARAVLCLRDPCHRNAESRVPAFRDATPET